MSLQGLPRTDLPNPAFQYSPGFGIQPNLGVATLVRGSARQASVGDHDLYTCPAGKKAYIDRMMVSNTSGVAGAAQVQIKISAGVYACISRTASISSGTATAITSQFVLTAGQVLSVNNAQIMTLEATLYEFDDTVSVLNLGFLRATALSNLLYTVPDGKQVIPLGSNLCFTPQAVRSSNRTAGTRTIMSYLVPPGETKSAVHLWANQSLTNTGALANVNFPVLPSGYQLWVDIDSIADPNLAVWFLGYETGV